MLLSRLYKVVVQRSSEGKLHEDDVPSQPSQSTSTSNLIHNASPDVEAGTPPDFIDDRTRIRELSRTPSPSPSEVKILEGKFLYATPNWRDWRKLFQTKNLLYIIIFVLLVAISILTTVLHDQIVRWLTPAGDWLKSHTGGWLIPIALLIILSFPPLFGHEFVAIICGLVWGLWIGFAIVAAGTLLGELANFFSTRWWLTSRAKKLEAKNLRYGILSKVLREGGFKVALMVRLSAIPPHFATVIFATCGMNVLVFTLAAVLSLPKQFSAVYFGVVFEGSGNNDNKTHNIVLGVVITVTIIVTIGSMRYITYKFNQAKPEYIYERRKARQVGNFKANSEFVGDVGSDAIGLGVRPKNFREPHATECDPVYQPAWTIPASSSSQVPQEPSYKT
ncbi:hypothetical protein OF83DRAFT_1122617 [Amylostereum chailletii]|nr:hypothetical protein OF83DRAFT_1122617 [Amylostereum chailletii]